MTRIDPEPIDILAIERRLQCGRAADLDALARERADFPHGNDPVFDRAWIVAALEHGNTACIEWMLASGVALDVVGSDGYGVLHAALERGPADRCEVLERLLDAGAPTELRGINNWTALHMAAARNDLESVRVLVRHGADRQARTGIDDDATPLEEARILGAHDVVRFLERIEDDRDGR